MNLKNIKKGFTLIELLLVISIIGLLASIVLTGLGNSREKARTSIVLQSLNGLKSTANLFSLQSGNNNSFIATGSGGGPFTCHTSATTTGGFFGTAEAVKLINKIKDNSYNKTTPVCHIAKDTFVVTAWVYNDTIKTTSSGESGATPATTLAYDEKGKIRSKKTVLLRHSGSTGGTSVVSSTSVPFLRWFIDDSKI